MASSNTRYPKWELHNIVNPFIEVLGEALKEGSEVRLKNLGKFVIQTKKERKFYNIQTDTIDHTADKEAILSVNTSKI